MLKADDFSVGDYITVLHGRNYELVQRDMDGNVITSSTQEDRSGKGDIMKVLAINLPYIVCLRLNGGIKGFKQVWDTRETKFMRLDKEYIEALNEKDI